MRLILLALLIPQVVWGAHNFGGTTADWASAAVVEVTDDPFTVACWGRSESDTADQVAFGIADSASGNNSDFRLNFAGAAVGDPIRAFVKDSGGTNAVAITSSAFTANTWHHATTVFASDTSRAAYIDGGSKGTNTDDQPTASLDVTTIGAVRREAPTSATTIPFDGDIAECGVWNVELTDAEVATLAKGFAPPCVRRASLIAYYPMVRNTTTLKDSFSATANNLTLNGTTAVSDHPRVINCQ